MHIINELRKDIDVVTGKHSPAQLWVSDGDRIIKFENEADMEAFTKFKSEVQALYTRLVIDASAGRS